jgi:hypothetical protein
MTRCTQTQQASSGIFIGFLSHQAGWLFYTDNHNGLNHIHTSRDATFDENFNSALVFDKHPFQGSLAFQTTPGANQLELFNQQEPTETTGSVNDFVNALR